MSEFRKYMREDPEVRRYRKLIADDWRILRQHCDRRQVRKLWRWERNRMREIIDKLFFSEPKIQPSAGLHKLFTEFWDAS